MNANFILSRAWWVLARRGVGAMAAALYSLALSGPAQAAPFAYITGNGTFPVLGTVQVLDAANNTVVATVPLGINPHGVAVTPDGAFVYIANGSGGVSVLDTATNTVVATVPVGSNPFGVAVTPDGAFVYVTQQASNTVSVIDTATSTLLPAVVPVGSVPWGIAVTPNGARAYVANRGTNTVSVIATASNTVAAPVTVGSFPTGVAVTPDGAFVYVTNGGSSSVSVIRTADNTVFATVPVGLGPSGVAVTPDGAFVYVANQGSNTVSVIATATNTVLPTVPVVGLQPNGVAVTPDGALVYVANVVSNDITVIASATNTVLATVPVGFQPASFGRFIGPAATFPFSGFFSPVDNPPTLNAMKAGAAVPVKFSLGGARGLDIFAANFPQSKPVACPGAGTPVDVVELTLTAGKSSLNYDVSTDTYTYAWKTDKAWAGTCRELSVRLTDGSNHTALFQFK